VECLVENVVLLNKAINLSLTVVSIRVTFKHQKISNLIYRREVYIIINGKLLVVSFVVGDNVEIASIEVGQLGITLHNPFSDQIH
jgi:hypothetical protein